MTEDRNCLSHCNVPGFPGYRVGNDGSVWSSKYLRGEWKEMRLKTHRKGYRAVTLRRDGKPHDRLVHRVVLEAFVGPCPNGMEACHENNNRSDNRLENLRWDTPKANQADRIRHGTANVGEQNPMSKLSSDDVAKIKKLWESGTVTQREIAGQLGVTSNHIWHILKGRRWAHAERINDESVIRRAGAAHYKSKFSDDDIVAIRNLARHGVSQREIADRYGVRQSTISAIVSRKTWKHIQEVSNG